MIKRKALLFVLIPVALLVAVYIADMYFIDNFFGAQSIPEFITGDGERLYKMSAKPSDGFYSEYYLFIPDKSALSEKSFLLVEPNNTGYVSDDHNIHVNSVKDSMKFSPSVEIARRLGIPLLMPCFDRPASMENMYTHALDRETLMYNDGNLARIDRQLIAMVEDARAALAEKGIAINPKMLLNGFSASGTFVNRFTAIYPEKVAAVAAGGVNSMVILPLDSYEGITLNYHVGVADLKEISGVEFNPSAFAAVPQFYYMGDKDDNDALPYDDAYDDAQREAVVGVLGEDMSARWQSCQRIYNDMGINARFRSYKDVGHWASEEAVSDIAAFFGEAMDNSR